MIRSLLLSAVLLSCLAAPRAFGQDAFDEASERIFVYDGKHVAFGNTPAAERLAESFGDMLQRLRESLFTEGRKRVLSLSSGHFITWCQVSAEGVCFLVHVPELKNFTTEARAQLLEVAWLCARNATASLPAASRRKLGVGLRGILLYGGVAVGADGTIPMKDTSSPADPAPLRSFFNAAQLAAIPATISEVSPRRVKGAWAVEPWRLPHALCNQPSRIQPNGFSRPRWQETCGAGPGEPLLLMMIRGSGFAQPALQNAVFVGGTRAQIVAGIDTQLTVRLPPTLGPGPADVVVRTAPGEVDDPQASGRQVAPKAVMVVGPPRALTIVEGDGQAATAGTTLAPIVVRLVDSSGEGVPGERIWFWLRQSPDQHTGSVPAPLHSESMTDALGVARVTYSLPMQPGRVDVLAEAINASQTFSGLEVVAKATALLASADMQRLLQQLHTGTTAARTAAAVRLGELGPQAAPAVPLLRNAISAPDTFSRQAAVEALARISPAEALPHYLAGLGQQQDKGTRMWAAEALGRLGPAARDGVPALVAVLKLNRGPGDSGPRLKALEALVSIGKDAAPAVPVLVPLLEDSNPRLRSYAARLLGTIGKPAAVPAEAALRRMASEYAPREVREAARDALRASFGGLSPTILEVVSGDGQRRSPRSHAEVEVRLTTPQGAAVGNELIAFSTSGAAAKLSAPSALTDHKGLARIEVVLGTKPGALEVTARYEASEVVARITIDPYH